MKQESKSKYHYYISAKYLSPLKNNEQYINNAKGAKEVHLLPSDNIHNS